MNVKACALLVGALLVLGWAFGSSASDYVDLGAGLLLRADGTVVAAWELPGCELAADEPEAASGMPAMPRGVWQVRSDRGW